MDKIDLPRLKADVPKYVAGGAFESNEALVWNNFLSSFECTYALLPEKNPPWLLDALPMTCMRVSQPSVQLPTKITDLHQAEKKKPSKVCIQNLCNFIFVIDKKEKNVKTQKFKRYSVFI